MVELFNSQTAAWLRLKNASVTPDEPGLFTVEIPGMPWGTRLNSLDGYQLRIDGHVSRQVVGVNMVRGLFGRGVLTVRVLI